MSCPLNFCALSQRMLDFQIEQARDHVQAPPSLWGQLPAALGARPALLRGQLSPLPDGS